MCANINFNKFVLNCNFVSSIHVVLQMLLNIQYYTTKCNVQLYEANTDKTQQRKPNREEEGISDLKSLNQTSLIDNCIWCKFALNPDSLFRLFPV